jgi:hypothetical protein
MKNLGYAIILFENTPEKYLPSPPPPAMRLSEIAEVGAVRLSRMTTRRRRQRGFYEGKRNPYHCLYSPAS